MPPELAKVIERMLAKSPALRPSTPADVVRALAAFTDGFDRDAQDLDLPDDHSALAGVAKVNSSRSATEWLPPGAVYHPEKSRSRLGLRAWWAAVGLVLLGLVFASGVVLKLRTSNGMIELVNLPRDAEVLVDGDTVAVTWPGSDGPAVVTVPSGKHRIVVKKDGLETSGDEVTVLAGGKRSSLCALYPSVNAPPNFRKLPALNRSKTRSG